MTPEENNILFEVQSLIEHIMNWEMGAHSLLPLQSGSFKDLQQFMPLHFSLAYKTHATMRRSICKVTPAVENSKSQDEYLLGSSDYQRRQRP